MAVNGLMKDRKVLPVAVGCSAISFIMKWR
jgi:hypothetical protein